MRRWSTLTAGLFVVLVTLTVSAGAYKKGVYTSNHGYTIEPPADWVVVDRGNHALLKDKIPALLAGSDVKTYDVLFYHPELEPPEEGTPAVLHDNILVVVVPSVPAAEAELAAAVAANVEAELKKIFAKVELVSSGAAEHGSAKTIDLEWKLEDAEGALKGFVLQSLMPGTTRSLLVTCTIGDARYADSKEKVCLKAFDSVKLND